MNRFGLIKTAYTALAALMLGACASDELTDGTVQDLPEGKYPLQISSVAMSAESTAQPWGTNTPQTRIAENTTDGKSSDWEGGEEITVQLSGKMADNNSYTAKGNYKLNSDRKTLSSVSGKELYWRSTSDGTVTAWYCNPAAASDNTVNLSDQSKGLAYVLSTTPQTVKYGATDTQLAFNHQLAKVRVKLKQGSFTDNTDQALVSIKSHTSCTINNGVVTGNDSEGYISMCRSTYGNETFYEANLVPGTLGKDNCFVFAIGDKSTEVSLDKDLTLVKGNYYTVTLTVNKA